MATESNHWVTVNSSVSSTHDKSDRLTIDCTRQATSCTGETVTTPPVTPRPEAQQASISSPRSSKSLDNDDTDTVICMGENRDKDMRNLIQNCAQDVQYISRGIAHSGEVNIAMLERWLERISTRLSRVPWHVSNTTILTTVPERIVVPEISTSGADSICSSRDMIKRVHSSICNNLRRQFSDLSVSETDAFRVLTPVDSVHLTGKYMRRGPLLWAQSDDDMYVLMRLELWPVHDASCFSFCCPVCWGDSQGVSDFLLDTEQIVSAAEMQLGENPYRGYSKLPWCW